jgi:hypothetical protein
LKSITEKGKKEIGFFYSLKRLYKVQQFTCVSALFCSILADVICLVITPFAKVGTECPCGSSIKQLNRNKVRPTPMQRCGQFLRKQAALAQSLWIKTCALNNGSDCKI